MKRVALAVAVGIVCSLPLTAFAQFDPDHLNFEFPTEPDFVKNTEPCVDDFDAPLTEIFRLRDGDSRVALGAVGTANGMRTLTVQVDGAPTAAWIYWSGEIRALDGEPDPSIQLTGGAIVDPLTLTGMEVGRRNQVFSDEESSGCGGNGGEIIMRAQVPLTAFAVGENTFTIADFNDRGSMCDGAPDQRYYRRQYGVSLIVTYDGGSEQCLGDPDPGSGMNDDDDGGSHSGGDDDGDDDDGDNGKMDDDDDGGGGTNAPDDDDGDNHASHQDDDDGGDTTVSDEDDDGGEADDDDDGGRGSSGFEDDDDGGQPGDPVACDREVIVLDGGDVFSNFPFVNEPNCDSERNSSTVCFEFESLPCDIDATLGFSVGGINPRELVSGSTTRIFSGEQTWFVNEFQPQRVIGLGEVIETNRLIDADFFYSDERMGQFVGTVSLTQGNTNACFQIELMPLMAGELRQNAILHNATLEIDRSCGAGGPAGDPPGSPPDDDDGGAPNQSDDDDDGGTPSSNDDDDGGYTNEREDDDDD